MLLSAVSVLVVAQTSSEIQEGLMNKPVYSFSFYMAQQTLVGQVCPIFETSRSHSDTPRSLGPVRMRDQPDEVPVT